MGHVKKEIASAIQGMDATDQKRIDRKMIGLDGTPNKGKPGGDAILAVSMAMARSAATSNKK